MAALGTHHRRAEGLIKDVGAHQPRSQYSVGKGLLVLSVMLYVPFFVEAASPGVSESTPPGNPAVFVAIASDDQSVGSVVDEQEPFASPPPGTTEDGIVEQENYRMLVREEAEESTPRIFNDVTKAEPGAGAQTEPSPAVTTANRMDSIKSAVRDALAAIPSDGVNGVDAEEPEASLSLSNDERRQRLRELVEATPTPDKLVDEDYLDELHKEVSVTLVTEEAASSEPIPNPQPAVAPKTDMHATRYRVRPGDSLWQIAEKVFGDGHRWPAIYDANRRALEDADVLHVGELLLIPRR